MLLTASVTAGEGAFVTDESLLYEAGSYSDQFDAPFDFEAEDLAETSEAPDQSLLLLSALIEGSILNPPGAASSNHPIRAPPVIC